MKLEIKIFVLDELDGFVLLIFKDKIDVITSTYDLLVEFDDVL